MARFLLRREGPNRGFIFQNACARLQALAAVSSPPELDDITPSARSRFAQVPRSKEAEAPRCEEAEAAESETSLQVAVGYEEIQASRQAARR